MEEMKNEISHCSQKLLVNFDNNAASCYDRIIPNIANLIGHKKGLHKSITFVHASTLAEAKFKLKTAFSTLFDINEELSNGAIFSDTIQEIEVHIALVGFIDDVTGQTKDFYNEKEDAQIWSDLLWLTGGLLELDECSNHFIWYKFLQDGTPIMKSTRPGPPLIIKQLNNKTNTEIQYKNPYTPHAMLGHQKAPGGGN
eukprot:14248946-Ditylum_brightwellii.AAC.1